MESSKNTIKVPHDEKVNASSESTTVKGKAPEKKRFLDRISANRLQQVAISIAVVIVAIFMYDLSDNASNSGQAQGTNTWVWPAIILLGVIFIVVFSFSVFLKRRKKRLKKLKRFGKT